MCLGVKMGRVFKVICYTVLLSLGNKVVLLCSVDTDGNKVTSSGHLLPKTLMPQLQLIHPSPLHCGDIEGRVPRFSQLGPYELRTQNEEGRITNTHTCHRGDALGIEHGRCVSGFFGAR